ncbi:hypothetical protein OGAPHI_000013 [Ogataea philodendri]|uniref:Uncharacterized protein n=1 Tax=Ogataea philodendri TaxID=1378263 RepID=A0A9P8PHE3_9ASCO|nr:uncharacterized protein OGAPHI_000013 [Ogataea philodendri]KAH3671827.1 hypothetical protein OGAPHI_000013 [Ogataea philodendri]
MAYEGPFLPRLSKRRRNLANWAVESSPSFDVRLLSWCLTNRFSSKVAFCRCLALLPVATTMKSATSWAPSLTESGSLGFLRSKTSMLDIPSLCERNSTSGWSDAGELAGSAGIGEWLSKLGRCSESDSRRYHGTSEDECLASDSTRGRVSTGTARRTHKRSMAGEMI